MKSEQEIQLSHDLHEIVAGQPFGPDVEAIARRGHQARLRSTVIRGAAALGAVAVGAAVIVSLVIPAHGAATGRTSATGRTTAKSPGGPAAGPRRPKRWPTRRSRSRRPWARRTAT